MSLSRTKEFGTLKVVESARGRKKGLFYAAVEGEENLRFVQELAAEQQKFETTVGSELLNEIIETKRHQRKGNIQ